MQTMNRSNQVCSVEHLCSQNLKLFRIGTAMPPQYHAPTTAEQEALELAGGTVIIGRGVAG